LTVIHPSGNVVEQVPPDTGLAELGRLRYALGVFAFEKV
jgi:hypothetical protein